MASQTLSASGTAGDHSTTADATYGAGTSYDWANLGNVGASDDAYTNAPGMTGTDNQTHRLDLKNWGFSIPSGATIDGIEASIEWRTSNNLRPLSEIQIRLLKASSPVGSNKATYSNSSTASDAVDSHGGVSDLWGATWDDTDVNGSGFGIALQYKSDSSSSKNPLVDHVTLTVHYTESGGGAIDGTASITEADDTVSAAGTVEVTAAGSITESDDTGAGSGTVAVDGAASVTEGDDSVASAGTVSVAGDASVTEADDTAAAAGIVEITGGASVTEGDDALSADGTVADAGGITGSADITEADDTGSASGVVALDGTASIAEGDDTLSATGALAVDGTAAIEEQGDTVAGTGTVGAGGSEITGDAEITEAADSASATGTVEDPAVPVEDPFWLYRDQDRALNEDSFPHSGRGSDMIKLFQRFRRRA